MPGYWSSGTGGRHVHVVSGTPCEFRNSISCTQHSTTTSWDSQWESAALAEEGAGAAVLQFKKEVWIPLRVPRKSLRYSAL